MLCQERHIQEVIEASQKINAHVSKVAEENLMRKMEEALKKREEQMTNFVDRMKSHVRRHISHNCIIMHLNMFVHCIQFLCMFGP